MRRPAGFKPAGEPWSLTGRIALDPLYRRAAQRTITRLLAENRRLRGCQAPGWGYLASHPAPSLLRALELRAVLWLDRKFPVPHGKLLEDVEVIET